MLIKLISIYWHRSNHQADTRPKKAWKYDALILNIKIED